MGVRGFFFIPGTFVRSSRFMPRILTPLPATDPTISTKSALSASMQQPRSLDAEMLTWHNPTMTTREHGAGENAIGRTGYHNYGWAADYPGKCNRRGDLSTVRLTKPANIRTNCLHSYRWTKRVRCWTGRQISKPEKCGGSTRWKRRGPDSRAVKKGDGFEDFPRSTVDRGRDKTGG